MDTLYTCVAINRLFVLSLCLYRQIAYIRTIPNRPAILNPVLATRSGIYTRLRNIDSLLPLNGITSCTRFGTFQRQPVTSRRLSCYPSTLGSLAVRSTTSRPRYRPRWYPVLNPPLAARRLQSSRFSSWTRAGEVLLTNHPRCTGRWSTPGSTTAQNLVEISRPQSKRLFFASASPSSHRWLAFASFSLNIATRPAIHTFPVPSTGWCHFDPVFQTGRFGSISLFFSSVLLLL